MAFFSCSASWRSSSDSLIVLAALVAYSPPINPILEETINQLTISYKQCCGSGSTWIRNFCLDPEL